MGIIELSYTKEVTLKSIVADPCTLQVSFAVFLQPKFGDQNKFDSKDSDLCENILTNGKFTHEQHFFSLFSHT